MKKILVLFCLFFLLLASIEAKAQWVQVTNGMGTTPRTVRAFAYIGNDIFVGFSSNVYGVYLSTNNGAYWTHTSLNQSVLSLAVGGNNIFAGTHDHGVYLSANNGLSWTFAGLNLESIRSLAVSGSNVFAGSSYYNGVYLSTNNGVNWIQTSLNIRTIQSLAINGNNIFAGAWYDNGVYLSTNNGLNWVQTSLNNRSISEIAVNGNNVFAGTGLGYGVYLSTDNGSNWSQTSLNNQDIWSLTVSGNNVFAGTYAAGVFVSNNNGVSWVQRNEGLGNANVRALCIFNNYIFAGTSLGSINAVYRRPLGELITSIKPVSELIPEYYTLYQNYPNPFNPITNIKFALPKTSETKMIVYNALGKEVAILVNEGLKAGSYEVDWDGSNYPSGVYFSRLVADDFINTKKMILLK